ncbi:hypothetical protein KIPB_004259 [Kipferlia bialata]|uniref:Uncharacterized protein n=1 Tax=Kipferlia bialata TaxID=797122 RepID=A0A9K3CUT1_9EUKA|nr:hypothetical protein KIPB_004259 [Kipferlia bialata]|eukprot:g4259.t1
MVTYHLTGDDMSQRWMVLTLNDEKSIDTQSISGPSNPEGVFGMSLTRVGEVVVAYGGNAMKGTNATFQYAWFMAVYSIDTAEWKALPYIEGVCPQPRKFPITFAVGDCLVVTGGWSKKKRTKQGVDTTGGHSTVSNSGSTMLVVGNDITLLVEINSQYLGPAVDC